MAKDLCVLCGLKSDVLRSTKIVCGDTVQTGRKACEKELQNLEGYTGIT